MKSRRKFLTAAIVVGMPAGILALLSGVQARTRANRVPTTKGRRDASAKLDPKLILEAIRKKLRRMSKSFSILPAN